MVASIIIAIAGLALSVGQVAFQEWLSSEGSKYRGKIQTLINQLQKKLYSNDTKLAQFQNAYQNRNSELLSRLMTGMGFGPRVQSIITEIKRNDDSYSEKLKEINKSNSEINNQISSMTQIANDASSIHGRERAEQLTNGIPDQGENWKQKQENLTDMVKGGMIL